MVLNRSGQNCIDTSQKIRLQADVRPPLQPPVTRHEMTDFLFGDALSQRIRDVCSGRQLRCAVAYWGADCEELLGHGVEDALIVCDARSGGTSPKALVSLGAPDNDRLRHADGLHAKVYLSEKGGVICSANASNNGIGFGMAMSGKLLEAGVAVEAGAAAWQSAEAWFDKLYGSAHQVDPQILADATTAWKKQRHPQPAKVGSLIELAARRPDVFDGIGFVVSGTSHSETAVEAARSSASKAAPTRKDEFRRWSKAQMFTDWDDDHLDRWPSVFFTFYMPRSKLSISTKRLDHREHSVGAVFASPVRLTARSAGKFPSLSAAAETDAPLVRGILEAAGGSVVFSTATDLAEFLEQHDLLAFD